MPRSDVQAQIDAAVAASKLTRSAAANVGRWLGEPAYAEYAPAVVAHIEAGKWRELDDAFWTVIPFGTGGRRGRMYPIGCNAINDRTIGESAQGLAEYVNSLLEAGAARACAIAYDTRHNSRHFAELCASIMAANGFTVHFLDGYRSTPELSFLVREKQCACGIMVTASHNPPSDNAVKIYWSTGGQVLPPHDRGILDRVMNAQEIRRSDFQQAVAAGQILLCSEEVDAAFQAAVLQQRFEGPRELSIVYSPLHGVGESAVVSVLKADGFQQVECFEPHREPSGDFPNVPNQVANPENPQVFDMLITHGRAAKHDLALATDPDCDRMGCAAPLTRDAGGQWATFTGNQLAALLVDYVCSQRRRRGGLSPQHFLVTTLVTTGMVRRIGDSYGVTTYDKLPVGFKWIAQQIDVAGPDLFLLGTEESHGFLIGQYVRDKDGVAACMLMAELAAQVKAAGKTLHDHLDSLYWQHGYHGERQFSLSMTGSAGMERMQQLMRTLRSSPPASLGGWKTVQLRDYLHGTATLAGGAAAPLPPSEACSATDLLILDFQSDGNYVAIRPSGTEPKVKFYLFTHVPAEQLHLLDETKREMDEQMRRIEAELRALAGE